MFFNQKWNVIWVLIILFFPLSVMAESSWNVAVGDWEDLSGGLKPNTAVLVKKTIADNLKQFKRFHITEIALTDDPIRSLSGAIVYGRRAQADVILYGYYYEQGNEVVIVVEVADVLKNQLKLRKVYHGPSDLDLLDTVDEMANDVSKMITGILPNITFEDEKEIRKIRKTLYEQQGIKLKRTFYTRMGVDTEFGPKIFISQSGGDTNPIETNQVSINTSVLDLAVTLRYAFVRLDFSGAGLPGIVVFDSFRGGLGAYDAVTSFGKLAVSVYLPFLDGQFALGLGSLGLSHISTVYSSQNNGTNDTYYTGDCNRNWSVFGTWNPNDLFDLQFGIKLPWFMYNQWDFTNPQTPNEGGYGHGLKLDVPAIYMDAIWFPFDLVGFEARFVYEKGTYFEGPYNSDGVTVTPEHISQSEQMRGYFGLVYRLNFL